ncbi:MAG: branched-chain amino acid ABC transporter substrate-binding protein [Actinobacteria bacterium HGW-Actinobacteria-6]|nr:MAG: branched-chain amino acid ABC transporter substrate-binding protein [Actinobacteria bacterium HGW-Actinobacteria-6]
MLVLGLAVTGCAAKTGTDGAVSGDEIIIGTALCQTGIQAPLDEPQLRGVQLAVDELNANGGILGKQVKLVALDGKSDPVTVGNVAKQLVDDGAAAIITPSDFDFGGPASREAQKAGLVGISPAASSPLYGSAALGDLQFTMSMWNTTMGAVSAEYAYNTLGYRSVYVITDDFIDYTKSLSKYFIVRFKELGGTVVFEDTYTQGQADVSAQLARIKALPEKPDFIYISSYMPDLGLMIRTLRESGITQPVIGGDAYDDPALWGALGAQYGSDVYYDTHCFFSNEANPGYDKWLASYQDKYGKDPETPMIMIGYDAMMVLAQSMDKAGTTEGAAVAKVMETTEYNLFTGKLKWSDAASGHEPNKAAAMVQLEAGTPKFLGWFIPEKIPAP